MRLTTLIIIVSVLSGGCTEEMTNVILMRQKSMEEIQKAEQDFQKMTEDKGIAEAFWFYADSNAVIKRENDTIIRGKEAIRQYYSKPFYNKVKVTWSPDFTDASGHGELGYTFGSYTWRMEETSGKITELKGVFHTVWKRQADGNWKYVWD